MTEDDTLTQLIGTRTSSSSVVVERGPVGGFAIAVCDQNPIYRDPRAAAGRVRRDPRTAHVSVRNGDLGEVPRAAT
jgi:hypothetical protein